MYISNTSQSHGHALSRSNPSAFRPTTDSIPGREIERHILRRIRRLDDHALTRLLRELRSLTTKEARHA